MISAVSGVLRGAGTDWVDVELAGVLTLRVKAPASTIEALGRPGDRVRLFTHLAVRDDDLSLFGFESEEARAAFEALIGISGIGPRVALSILSVLKPEMLALAVSTADLDAFRGVHGVGKKTASRIVLELAGKLALLATPTAGAIMDTEVIEALMALDISAAEARQAASNLSLGPSDPLDDRVLEAFQRIGSE